MSCLKKIHEKTPSAFPNSLGLFDLPPTNVAFTNTGFRAILCSNPVTDEPYSFRVFSDNLWLDLSKTYVQLEFSISSYDSTTKQYVKVTSDSIAPIQLIVARYIHIVVI
uniref:Malectin-like domain-containing protein n=1 Tax=Panagrolaimus davidi TaxID=227884 RepID=A0A914P7H2_9BILA